MLLAWFVSAVLCGWFGVWLLRRKQRPVLCAVLLALALIFSSAFIIECPSWCCWFGNACPCDCCDPGGCSGAG